MNRRRFLHTTAVGLAGMTAFAGCSSSDGRSGRTVNPALRDTPTETATATPPPTAFGAGDADSLDHSRSLVVTNQLVRPEWVTIQIEQAGTQVLGRTLRVPAAGTRTIDGVFGAPRTFTTTVRTADGRSRQFDWQPGPGGDHLGVDLDGGISVRDTYPVSAAHEFVEGSTGNFLAATPATAGARFVVDTPGGGGRVRITAADGDGAAGVDLRVPPESRVPLALSVPRGRIVVAAETPAGVDRRGWRPFEDGSLYCVLDSSPRLVCDLLVRDVIVRNETDSDDGIAVSIDADGERVLDWTVYPAAGGNVRIPTAVPPAGTFVVTVRTDDRAVRQTLSRCPARGPIVVRVSDDAVDVDARPVDELPGSGPATETPPGTPIESSNTTRTETATETATETTTEPTSSETTSPGTSTTDEFLSQSRDWL